MGPVEPASHQPPFPTNKTVQHLASNTTARDKRGSPYLTPSPSHPWSHILYPLSTVRSIPQPCPRIIISIFHLFFLPPNRGLSSPISYRDRQIRVSNLGLSDSANRRRVEGGGGGRRFALSPPGTVAAAGGRFCSFGQIFLLAGLIDRAWWWGGMLR